MTYHELLTNSKFWKLFLALDVVLTNTVLFIHVVSLCVIHRQKELGGEDDESSGSDVMSPRYVIHVFRWHGAGVCSACKHCHGSRLYVPEGT